LSWAGFSTKEHTVSTDIHCLYEELIYLDQLRGQLDPETNQAMDSRCRQIQLEIQRLTQPQPDSTLV
jgi:hypothetical protein